MFCNPCNKITGRYIPFFLSHKHVLIALKSDFKYPLTIAFYRDTGKYLQHNIHSSYIKAHMHANYFRYIMKTPFIMCWLLSIWNWLIHENSPVIPEIHACNIHSTTINMGRPSSVIYLDFCKIFNSVPHNILKSKRKRCGFKRWTTWWIRN